ncbi:MAG: hypothetical protein WBD48_14390 [Pseudolabrys sp.]
MPREHEQPVAFRQRGGDFLGQSFGQKNALGIGSRDGEWKNDNGRNVFNGERESPPGRRERNRHRGDGFFPHLADEAKAPAVEGFDEPLFGAVVADGLTRGVDARAERRIRDDAPMPYRREDIVTAHDAVAISDEIVEEIENLRLDRLQKIAAAQLAPACIENAVLKSVDQSESPTPQCADGKGGPGPPQ